MRITNPSAGIGKLPSPTTASNLRGRTTLFHLDHMNDHRGYQAVGKVGEATEARRRSIPFVALPAAAEAHLLPLGFATGALGGTGEFLTRLRTRDVDVTIRGKPCKERMSTVVAEFPLLLPPPGENQNSEDKVPNDFRVVETEGGNGSQTHMPFVRDWLSREYGPEDAAAIIAAMDGHLDSTTKQKKRR